MMPPLGIYGGGGFVFMPLTLGLQGETSLDSSLRSEGHKRNFPNRFF